MINKYRPRIKLIKLRKEKGFTQEQMARLLKIKRATYANYETGYRNPSLKYVIEMKKILGTEDDAVFLPPNDTISVWMNANKKKKVVRAVYILIIWGVVMDMKVGKYTVTGKMASGVTKKDRENSFKLLKAAIWEQIQIDRNK